MGSGPVLPVGQRAVSASTLKLREGVVLLGCNECMVPEERCGWGCGGVVTASVGRGVCTVRERVWVAPGGRDGVLVETRAR